ncbi:unnamed protein product [Haemonchus placei]|uniref:Luc7-like protein 3 n=1 Tax=Haemonchus placei TaxID=6290 RepID=A0A158QKQ9_HAEPC|nr:unnamed protein product [Haemonchus placei]
MTDYMAQMLNELMGPQRNSLPGEGAAIDFDHPDVCRDFLVGFCLAEAFRNTKNDLGFCQYPIHDEALKKRYQESNRFGRLGYEEKYFERLNRLHNEVRRKIEKNEARLVHTRADTHVSSEVYDKKKQNLIEKREILGRRIEGLMEEAEIEGAQGNVAAAQTAVQKADELTKERDALQKEEENLEIERQRAIVMEEQLTAGNKQMQVCQVCGCFMLTNDAQSRIDDHLSGKLHIAYTRIKEQIDLMAKNKEEKRLQLEREKGKDRDDKTERKHDDRDRDRERDRDRKERDSRRDRSRDRDRKSSRRSRSRDGRDRRSDDRRGSDRRDRRDRSRSRDRRAVASCRIGCKMISSLNDHGGSTGPDQAGQSTEMAIANDFIW